MRGVAHNFSIPLDHDKKGREKTAVSGVCGPRVI